MSLDNQRNLKLAIARDDLFMKASEQVADEMNGWAKSCSPAVPLTRPADQRPDVTAT